MVCLSEQAIRPLTNHVFCNYCACFDLQKHSSIMIRKKLGRGRLFFTKAGDSATCRKIFCSPSTRPCALRSSQLLLTRQAFSARLSFDFSKGFKKKIDFVNNLVFFTNMFTHLTLWLMIIDVWISIILIQVTSLIQVIQVADRQ